MVAGLARLAELEHEAAQACDRGADAIAEVDLAQRLHEDAAVHRARRESLAELIAGLGGSAPSEGESRKLLTHGLTAVQDAATNQAVLDSLLAMRDELSAAYREVAALPALDAQRQAAIAALAPSEG